MIVRVNKIVETIIGEGESYGKPCVNIVLAGEDTFGENIPGTEIDYSEVKSKVDELLGDFKQNKLLYVTGGEPLNQEDFLEQLCEDYPDQVCIKTSYSTPALDQVCTRISRSTPTLDHVKHILAQVRRENYFNTAYNFNELIILVDEAMTYEEFMGLEILKYKYIKGRMVWLMPREMNQKLWAKCYDFVSRTTMDIRLGIQLKCEKGLDIKQEE